MKTTNSVTALTALCVLALSVAVSGAPQDLPLLQREAVTSPTLSGCVTRGAAAGTYTLTSGAKKDAPPPKAGDQPLTVALTGTDVDLAPHLGHTVSLTGSYEATWGPIGTPVGTSGTPAPPAAATTAKDLRTFAVKSLKMVAPSCSAAAD